MMAASEISDLFLKKLLKLDAVLVLIYCLSYWCIKKKKENTQTSSVLFSFDANYVHVTSDIHQTLSSERLCS